MSHLPLQTSQSSMSTPQRQGYEYEQQQQQQQQQQLLQHMHQARSLPASPSSPTLPAAAIFPAASSSSSPQSSSFQDSFDDASSRRGADSPNHYYSSGPNPLALQQNSLNSSRPRKTAPSPLQTSTVLSSSSTPSTPSPSAFRPYRPPSTPQLHDRRQVADDWHDPVDLPRIVTTSPRSATYSPALPDPDNENAKTYFDSDSSPPSSPVERSQSPGPSSPLPQTPNDQSVVDSVASQKPLAGSAIASREVMAAATTTSRSKAVNGGPRNASMDSGVSSLMNGSGQRKSSGDDGTSSHDIASIIKAAGSPEAVIEHLLKEKKAQYQQNAQLWRLVDKQRAMILGLNKDLERALKDKEKYRKKLKEVLPDESKSRASVNPTPSPALQGKNGSVQEGTAAVATTETAETTERTERTAAPAAADASQVSPLQSPVDVSMAPYPITPPADRVSYGPLSAVGEILDPVATMPRPQDHALGNYDHEAEDRAADSARKQASNVNDIPLNLSLPPSRSLPSVPPRMPPPRIPPPAAPMSSSVDPVSESIDEGLSQFPSPPAPASRKPPPAPLMLRDPRPNPGGPADDEAVDSDSDYDSLLDVAPAPETEKRGRRRTREEDDREREILAQKEAEMRSLSKKSKKNGSAHNTAAAAPTPTPAASGPIITQTLVVPSPHGTASLDGVLGEATVPQRNFSAPMLNQGLPLSPRPVVSLKSPLNSPPMSPRFGTGFPAAGPMPLSPRPPRQPIPLPPNTPLQTPSPAPGEPLNLAIPKPLNPNKAEDLSVAMPVSPSSKSETSLDSPATRASRSRIFKGFVTEEYPDLLLPPNALPSIDIKVASSRMKPSRASLISLTQLEEDPVFTLAVFSRADGGELWRVEKDSASLAKLDQRMKQCPSFTARTPDRSLFSGHAPAKLDARRQALNQYLDELVNTPLDTNAAIELCRYLSTNTLPPYADETGSSHHEAAKESKASSHKTGAAGRPLKNGYLTKRGKNFGGWKARFFMLEGPLLKYYETPGGAHLGTIKLQNAQIGKQSQNNDSSASPARPGMTNGSEDLDNQYRHAFLILEPKKKDPSAMTKHVLCAESDLERDQWVDTLLRWIDYRDPEDEEESPVMGKKEAEKQQLQQQLQQQQQQQQPSKKKYGPSKKQRQRSSQSLSQLSQHQSHSSESKDSLIGVSYEATQAGDVPQGAPGTDVATMMPSPAPYATMAGQRDPQVMPDPSMWANRGLMGGNLAPPPTTEEKKVRKRSFFGFGPKTRTSTEGSQDLLFGDSGNGNGNGGYNVPPRQVFGATLAEAVKYNSPMDVRVPLPAVVYRCIEYLDARGALNEEGIFRLSGSNVVIKQLRERFNNESDVNLLTDSQYHDLHAVASLLKMYLRELPTTILTRELHMKFLSVTEMPNQDEKLAALAELARRLPEANATLLKYLISFLIRIINRADRNKMTVRNVGIVFSPTLNIPAPVFALLLQNYVAIFNIEPEEYEVPISNGTGDSPSRNGDRRPSLASSLSAGGGSGNGFEGLSVPPRPATAHTSTHVSESPQRQRVTPTPPPMAVSFGQARSTSTPTPPPMQPLYEGSASNNYVMPQSYERPMYQMSNGSSGLVTPYDSGKGGNRRESAILPGGAGMGMNMNFQGPRNGRLREEGRY